MTDDDMKTLERLARAVEKINQNPKRMILKSFLIGAATGLGTTVGVAAILTLVGLLLRWLGGFPGLTDWLNAVSKTKY